MRLFACKARQIFEKFAVPLGVQPLPVIKFKVVTAGLCGHPYLLQRFLQIDNNLAAVCECESHHAAHALIINIGQAFVIDSIATRLDVSKETLGVVHVVSVSHYNFTMLLNIRILVSALILVPIAVILPGCGQQGPLYLPTEPAAANRATLPESLMPFKSDDSKKSSVKDNTLAPKTPQ